jgi:MoxR-like ATPase
MSIDTNPPTDPIHDGSSQSEHSRFMPHGSREGASPEDTSSTTPPANLSYGNPEALSPPAAPPTEDPFGESLSTEAARIQAAVSRIKAELGKVIVGQDALIELMIAALLTNGHVLIEGVPGIAKTLTSKLLAQSIKVGFARIQFTPDLMPTDIIGTTVFDMNRSEFHFKKGPIFSQVVLIDEINRAPAKTQAALMEVMEEEQVTVDGHTYPVEPPFFVVATQNPVEQEGTYKLPEAQLDRFMFKLHARYPSLAEETAMLDRFRNDFYGRQQRNVQPVIDAAELLEHRACVEAVHIKDPLLHYIASIVAGTRNNSDLYLGASPRASINILKASKALALMRGRSFVTPDDIKDSVYPVLNHRLILSYDREIEGVEMKDVIEGILRKVEVPR